MGGCTWHRWGLRVQPDLTDWVLKPFQTSTTFANLRRTNRCIFHVVDDVELLVKGVLGVANDAPATWIEDHGYCLNESCHWYALKMDHWDISNHVPLLRRRFNFSKSFAPFGWNRAKHAVLEGAILKSSPMDRRSDSANGVRSIRTRSFKRPQALKSMQDFKCLKTIWNDTGRKLGQTLRQRLSERQV